MKCLTEIQIPNLNTLYNLSDAHARQLSSNGISHIVEKLTDIFYESEKSNYEKLLSSCFKVFMNASGQYRFENFEFLASCTASQSMEVVANYLRIKELNVYLIEPTFDNIPDILKRHNIKLFPLNEENLRNMQVFSGANMDCIFITLPNNPTGHILDQREFEGLVSYCSKNSIILIIDACFRLFDSRVLYDWYEIITRYELKFIIIEDTGKIWPTQDLKVSFIVSDINTIKLLSRISNDFLLNVSPFVLKLVIEVANSSKRRGFLDFRMLLQRNREYLIESCRQSVYLDLVNPESRVSVALLKIGLKMKANELVEYLYNQGIGLLPGTPFYWNKTEMGESFIRVALARDESYFRQGIDKLFNSVNILVNGIK